MFGTGLLLTWNLLEKVKCACVCVVVNHSMQPTTEEVGQNFNFFCRMMTQLDCIGLQGIRTLQMHKCTKLMHFD